MAMPRSALPAGTAAGWVGLTRARSVPYNWDGASECPSTSSHLSAKASHSVTSQPFLRGALNRDIQVSLFGYQSEASDHRHVEGAGHATRRLNWQAHLGRCPDRDGRVDLHEGRQEQEMSERAWIVCGWLSGWAVGALVALTWVRSLEVDDRTASLSVVVTSVFAGSFCAAGVREYLRRKRPPR